MGASRGLRVCGGGNLDHAARCRINVRTQVGRAEWRDANGSARPRFGNIDDDAAEEIVVGFAGDGAHELQIYDDLYGGKMAIFRDGMGFVASGDDTDVWIAAPAH